MATTQTDEFIQKVKEGSIDIVSVVRDTIEECKRADKDHYFFNAICLKMITA